MNNETDTKKKGGKFRNFRIFVTYSRQKCKIIPIACHEGTEGYKGIALLF